LDASGYGVALLRVDHCETNDHDHYRLIEERESTYTYIFFFIFFLREAEEKERDQSTVPKDKKIAIVSSASVLF